MTLEPRSPVDSKHRASNRLEERVESVAAMHPTPQRRHLPKMRRR